MSTYRYFSIICACTLALLVLATCFTVPASADGGAIPPASPRQSTQGRSTPDNSSAPPLVPSGTKLIVLDAQGDKLPLGSQAAQTIVSSGDPIWCPSSVAAPAASGLNGCTVSDTSLYNLISDIYNGSTIRPNANGTIWILGGADPDSSNTTITIDGSDHTHFANWGSFTLTLKGGWKGFHTGAVDTTKPSTFSQEIQIVHWQNNITLSDVQVNGNNTLFGSGEGLDLETSKNISLTRVQADNNWGYGAYLDTTGGTNGTVTLTDSLFDGNNLKSDFNSLIVNASGAITLSNASVTNGYGALLDNHLASSAAPVTIGGGSAFNGNAFAGLAVSSKGAIQATGLQASHNAGGASFNNSYGTAGVTLSGTNDFSNNAGGDGLDVVSSGAVTLNGVSAGQDNGYGAHIVNDTGTGSVTITGAANTFSHDTFDGLYVSSKGQITASGLTAASDNTSGSSTNSGVYLINSAGTAGVTLTGTNSFTNDYYGMRVITRGAVSLQGLTAAGNTATGLLVDNSASTTFQGVKLTGTNTFNTNSTGLSISSAGPVSLNDVTASGNSLGSGAELDATAGTTAHPAVVTLTGVNQFNNNGGDGLSVTTYGAITAGGLTAGGNGNEGALLDNHLAVVPAAVTLTGGGTFDSNGFDGLSIATKGSVSAGNLVAIYDYTSFASPPHGKVSGVYIDATVGTGSVTLTGTNFFSHSPSGYGITVLGSGAVKLNNVTADGDYKVGAYIDNSTSSSRQPVTLSGSSEFNFGSLTILSAGAITVNNITASFGYGSTISNLGSSSAHPEPVQLTGTNTFSDDGEFALLVESYGPITTSNLTSNGDGGTISAADVILDNHLATQAAAVTLNGVNTFNNDHLAGLEVLSNGAITASNLNASIDLGDGVFLDNHASAAPGAVTVKGASLFNADVSDGLHINASGAVSLTNTVSEGNATDGVHITTPGTVTITNITSGINAGNGVTISAAGAISVTCGSLLINSTGAYLVSPTNSTFRGVDVQHNGTNTDVTGGGTLTQLADPGCLLP